MAKAEAKAKSKSAKSDEEVINLNELKKMKAWKRENVKLNEQTKNESSSEGSSHAAEFAYLY